MITSPAQETGRQQDERLAEHDERIHREALEHLAASGYLLLRRLRCEVAGGIVTISGAVPTFHLKQVAQTVLLKVQAAREVRNLLEVR